MPARRPSATRCNINCTERRFDNPSVYCASWKGIFAHIWERIAPTLTLESNPPGIASKFAAFWAEAAATRPFFRAGVTQPAHGVDITAASAGARHKAGHDA